MNKLRKSQKNPKRFIIKENKKFLDLNPINVSIEIIDNNKVKITILLMKVVLVWIKKTLKIFIYIIKEDQITSILIINMNHHQKKLEMI